MLKLAANGWELCGELVHLWGSSGYNFNLLLFVGGCGKFHTVAVSCAHTQLGYFTHNTNTPQRCHNAGSTTAMPA